MLVNLMPPVDATVIRLREPEIVLDQPARGRLVVHPRYGNWLARCGIRSAADVFHLSGEIVSGHANRHVVEVKLASGNLQRSLFLKREHSVGWRVRLRNRRGGFGPVSRSEREARTLEKLEAAGLPGPQWIAYGEDGEGRAFLLVDALIGCRELRTVLADTALANTERAGLAAKLGEALADLHDAGFDTPDLAAKHVFVRSGSHSVTILDWQSTRPQPALDAAMRIEALANLDASLVEWLATPRERLRALRAYLKRSHLADWEMASIARSIAVRSLRLRNRSSIRHQRQSNGNTRNQRLVWLANEAVCTIPDVARHWPVPAVTAPYYPEAGTVAPDSERLTITIANRPATLLRFRTADPLGRAWAAVRGKAWRSPAARLARTIFHLQNAGVDVPQLLAFGQQSNGIATVDSFLVYGLLDGNPTLAEWLAESDGPNEATDRMIERLGATLRSVHEAGCELGSARPALRIVPSRGQPRLVIDPTFGMRLHRRLADSQRVRDLTAVARSLEESVRPDSLRLLIDAYSNGPDAVRLMRIVTWNLRKRVASA